MPPANSDVLPSPPRGAGLLARCMPHSLRAQFAVALFAMAMLVVAGGATAVYALEVVGSAARQLAEERLALMNDAQDLQLRTTEIQLLADQMVMADSRQLAQQRYEQILDELELLEQRTARLATSADASVLDLHMASQLFRSSAHVMAYLRESEPPTEAGVALRTAALAQHRALMQAHALAMMRSARVQSALLTQAYLAAVERVVATSRTNAWWVVGWLAFSLLSAWLIARILLGHHVIDRLQQVSRSLRRADDGRGGLPPLVPVQGDDEIGAMARAVEQFLADRGQLATTRARLEEEQQRLAAIFDATADTIVVLQAGRVTQLNRAARSMFGMSQTQAIGTTIDALLPGFNAATEVVPGRARDAIARGADGRTFPVELSVNPVVSRGGELIVLVIRDATLRKEAEKHLIAARDAAEAARAAQAAFLASMSHELRTPLNGVLGYAQILALEPGLGEKQRFAVETIRTSGEHLLALINDLLDLAKHGAGKLELFPDEVQLRECLRVTSDIIRVKAEEAGLSFVVDVAADVPPVIIADEKRLRQVLLNLLGNAVKFTDRGSVTLRVGVAQAGQQRARLHFSVRDTGIGMREDQLETIFHPFEQVGDRHRRTAGSGLGLAISRQLVRLMGGDIQVASTPGRGTSFSFDLEFPLVDAAGHHAGAEPQRIGYRGPRRRILVADDLAANRLVLVDMLRPLGFEIDEAADGLQALERVRAQAPDLIVMDIDMPLMDGATTMATIRRDPAVGALPIIAVSATVDADGVAIGPGQGANAFLPKPLDRERLLREIARQLGLEWITGTPLALQPD